MELVAGLIVASFVVGSLLTVIRQHRRPTYADDPLGEPEVDVGGVVIAIDARARQFIEAHVGREAPPESVKCLRDTIDALLKTQIAWKKAVAYNGSTMRAEDATEQFDSARNRFRDRHFDACDGCEGLALVGVFVAARAVVDNIHSSGNRTDLLTCLASWRGIPDQDVVEGRVLWLPSDHRTCIAAEALEVGFSELNNLDSAAHEYCTKCAGPYATNANACPHCKVPTSMM